MTKNGFFHERPDDYDIYVSPHMVDKVGSNRINWHVTNARNDARDIIADVYWKKTFFTAVLQTWGADRYWTIIR